MSNSSQSELRHEFLSGLRENDLVDRLLEHLPENIYFFVKDAQGRFMLSNRSFWHRMGLTNAEDLVGKTDDDFFWALQAEAYRQDDALVYSGVPQIEKLEIIPTADGLVDWYTTTKIPLRGKEGGVAGLVGITHDLRSSRAVMQTYRAMEPVIAHILAHYAEPIRAEELAELADMSLARFTRRFKREFQVTPSRYIAMVRLNVTCRQLAATPKPIAEIAREAGFYDHSFFTKQFVKYKGMTPKEFRARFQEMSDRKRFFPLGVVPPPPFAGEGAFEDEDEGEGDED